MRTEIGDSVSFWSASEKRYVAGVIVKTDTFKIMYDIDIGERIVSRHRSDLWPADLAKPPKRRERSMKKAALVAAVALAGGIYVGTVLTPQHEVVTPVEAPHYVDKQAVINALSTKAQLVGLTGKVAKTITYEASEWYGDKTYKLAATGTFKLGVNTSDISVTTHGNTVTVKFPQPKLLIVDMPFDKAKLSKDVGMFRKDLNESQLQAMFGKARTGAVEDIKRNRQAFDKASDSVDRTIEALVQQVDGVEHIEIMEAK